MAHFTVSARDKGDFLGGAIAWDILNRTGNHSAPLDGVDLRYCRHLKPYSIACLAALGARAGGWATLTLPTNQACREHVVRCGLCDWFFGIEVPSVVPRDNNVPVRQLIAGPENFADHAMELWANEMDGRLAVNQRRDFANHLDEMVLNALQHSASPVGCFVAGQSFPSDGDVEVAIVDLGMTIRAHLAGNPQNAGLCITTDEQAILASLRDAVTGTPPGQFNRLNQPNSGAGLASLHELCRVGGCNMTILSGDSIFP